MATPFNFKSSNDKLADHATNMLRSSKAREKADWQKLPIDSLPEDLAKLAKDAAISAYEHRMAMNAFREAMNDKLVAPAGKKFIFAVERGVTDPNMVEDILFAVVNGSTSQTATGVSFDQLTAKYK